MPKPTALLARLLPCCSPADDGPEALQALLDRRHVGILSAACCDATAAAKDAQLQQHLQQAMQQAGDARPVVVETITRAQRQLRALEAQADEGQRQLVRSVVALFQGHGLSVFPMLIVDGRIAFYGGVPSAEMIAQRLQRRAAAPQEA